MSLQSVTEVALHIGRFRNVDLFYQGLYHLRCRIFHERGEQTIDAVPHVFEGGSAGPPGSGATRHLLPPSRDILPAAVVKNEAAFRTKSFLVRYCEEEFDINDIGQFRVEQDALRDDAVLMLEMKLMWADLAPHGGADPFDPEVNAGPAPKVVESEFCNVSTQLYRLHGTSHGLHAFCPCIFDENHFCQVNLMVHASLLDFRLRLKPDSALSPYVRTPGFGRMARGNRGGSNGCMAEMMLELARAASDDAEGGDADSLADGFTGEPDQDAVVMAEALDRLQVEYVRRLVAAHGRLADMLARIAATQDENPSGPNALQMQVKEMVLPGHQGGPGGGGGSPLSTRWSGGNACSAAKALAEDLAQVSAQVWEAWQLVLKCLPRLHEDLSTMLKDHWEQETNQRWAESIMCETCSAPCVARPDDREIWETHSRRAADLRRLPAYVALPPFCIEDLSLLPPQSAHPVVFEQRYAPESEARAQAEAEATGGADVPRGSKRVSFKHGTPTAEGAAARASTASGGGAARVEPPGGVHVIVLVHGFQGNSYDMRLIRNNIALSYPKSLYLCSSANELDTEGDIQQMGEKLAEEVRHFVRDWCPGRPEPALGRLSFVAHSVGGLIVRSALPSLLEFSDKMYTYISLSTPHLGYMYAANTAFKTGLWVAKKLRSSRCLEQLSMTDSLDHDASFLSRLAHTGGLEHFRHLALVSSYQDQYAPFESARMEISSLIEADQKLGPIYMRLAEAILNRLDVQRLIRFDVNFHIPETNLDTVIGRAAHIQFIESQTLMKMMVHKYGFLFE